MSPTLHFKYKKSWTTTTAKDGVQKLDKYADNVVWL